MKRRLGSMLPCGGGAGRCAAQARVARAGRQRRAARRACTWGRGGACCGAGRRAHGRAGEEVVGARARGQRRAAQHCAAEQGGSAASGVAVHMGSKGEWDWGGAAACARVARHAGPGAACRGGRCGVTARRAERRVHACARAARRSRGRGGRAKRARQRRKEGEKGEKVEKWRKEKEKEKERGEKRERKRRVGADRGEWSRVIDRRPSGAGWRGKKRGRVRAVEKDGTTMENGCQDSGNSGIGS